MKAIPSLLFLSIATLFIGCDDTQKKETLAANLEINKEVSKKDNRTVSEEFKNYWYAGTAEITSYELTQERYGELREGTAVNVFVTEDFLPKEQVKADRQAESNVPVLKLNTSKKFLTGIYPYSLMTSTFNPVNESKHSIKITHSMQEWCGHVYMQLNNRKKYEVVSHSYFEGESDQSFSLDKTWLENELWSIIRLNPSELPTGEFDIVPAFEYTRMAHKELRAYSASGILELGNNLSTYTLTYPELKRELRIYFTSQFPHSIERWEEIHANGLTTTAKKLKSIQSPYWSKNSNNDLILRDSLGL